MELETDKAVIELPIDIGGTIEKVLVSQGQSVPVGQPLILVAAAGAAKAAAPSEALAPAAAAPETRPAPAEPAPAAAPAAPAAAASGGGRVTFNLPALGEGVKSADVAEIIVKEGDVLTAEQVVMELETEKAVMELPCPIAGTVVKVLVKEGDTIEIGAPVLEIEAGAGAAVPAPAAPAQAPAASAAPAASNVKTGTIVPAPAANNGSRGADSSSSGAPVPAAPSTRRMARELGVDLSQVRGSGRGGRITAEDVQTFVRERLQGLTTTSRPTAVAVSGGGISAPPLPDFSKYGDVERQAMNKIARVSAENLTVSWNVIPHVTQYDLADITDLEAARKRFGAGIGKNGPKVTMTAIVMKALATCLQAYPKFNSSLDPETNEIVLKKFFNIGCAVDTPNGLVVPVVKGCDKKSILQIAADITELATKARDRKLGMDDMQGATCTVTNLGGIGGIGFTPIVNYPEVCILGMSRGQTELKLVDGKVVERLMLPLSLSYDHRVINGADAARFVATLCNLLADPFQLMTTV
ncbi:MAG: 2-oxo acid dehydrogenase subunit E2 [Planctomycetaceae bacterium]|nr:2-oxo acid dehydrogenase subunit E2 [Planctomycetaceae bacterium]